MNHYKSFRSAISLVLITLFVGVCNMGGTPASSTAAGITPTTTPNIAATASWPPPNAPVAPKELIEAAQNDDVEAIKALLAQGVQIDSIDEQGATALIWAATYGHAKTVEFLISNGANVNAAATEDRMTPLHLATQYGEEEVVSILLKNGAQVNVGTHRGYTPLYFAIMAQNVTIVEMLLERQADVNLMLAPTESYPRSPFLMAVWLGDSEIVKLLQSHDAKDPWLSSIPEFDTNNFSPLKARRENGGIMVGSVPYILAQHFAARPWIAPSESSHETTGNNFFTWDSSSEGEFPLIVITDEDDHLTLGYILLPAFIGEGGVIYHENVNTVSEGGPFATVRVKGARGKVILKRGEESIELKADDKGIAVLSNVQQNEPVTVDIYGQGTAPAYSINFDCVVRGATPDTVIYEVNQSN